MRAAAPGTAPALAERLVLSPRTTKTYLARLCAKFSARGRAQLVVTAYETGLVVRGRGG